MLLPLPQGDTFLATAENWIIYMLYLTSYIISYRRSLVSIFRCAFRHFCGFLPTISVCR